MRYLTDYPVGSERFVLDKLRVGAQTAVGQNAVLHVQENPSDFLGGLMVRLESEVLAEKLVGGTYTGYGHKDFPSSPWQFFKQNHAESWWLRWLVVRRPVKTERHTIKSVVEVEAHRTYPSSRIQTPDLGKPVIWEQLRWLT